MLAVLTERGVDAEMDLVDLFCGAGGLSAGLEKAGWRTVSAVEQNADCAATLTATRAAGIPIDGRPDGSFLESCVIHEADVLDITADDLRPAGAGPDWRPGVLAGGPPCQPFSSAGRQKGLEDPRGELFLQFVRLARELRPHLLLFENVRGLVTAKTPDGQPGGVLRLVQESFEEIGYACRFQMLNAADFGAPQRRVRLFMLGALDRRLPEFPPPTHERMKEPQLFAAREPWTTLGAFMDEQPEPELEDVVRPSGRWADALRALEPGKGLRTGGIVEANRPGGHWGYRQDGFLADPDLPARTIRAASTPDWIREPDGDMRRLTWRECAGLQGFPAGWAFQGSRASRFRQIGNAVQVRVATALGAALRTALEGPEDRPESAPWPQEFLKRVRYTEMEARVNGAHRAAARQERCTP